MRKNIDEVLMRGEKMDRIENMTDKLKQGSKDFVTTSQWINFQAKMKAYLPIAAIVFVLIVVMYLKFA